MVELPHGTVTFLFADVEGSTQLVKQLRDRYPEVLREYERIVREAVVQAGGQIVDTQGDAVFAVFGRARHATGAAVAAQRALGAHSWPEGASVRARMGIHTGEPIVASERYHGLGVHRAARIMSAAHGGQVLLSNTTRDLIEDDLAEGIALRDLGERRLKDLDRPERLFQLVVPGLPAEFPPLRTAETTTTPFAGRERDLASAATRAVASGGPSRRRTALVAAVAGALAAAVAIPLFALGRNNGSDRGSPLVSARNALAVIDPATNQIVDSIPLEGRPSVVAVGQGSIWAIFGRDRTVARIDPKTRKVVKTVGLPQRPSDVAVGEGAVWFANLFAGTVSRLDPETYDVFEIPLAETTGGEPVVTTVAAADGAVWAGTQIGARVTIVRIDPQSSEVVARIRLPGTSRAASVRAGEGSVWVVQPDLNRVVRIDPATNSIRARIQIQGPAVSAVGSEAIWITAPTDDAVWRIDPLRDLPLRTIRVGVFPLGLAVGKAAVWVANVESGTVSRIDPASNTVRRTIQVSSDPHRSGPVWVAVGDGAVWVAIRQTE